jgi:glucose/arabinose dehydrogenase
MSRVRNISPIVPTLIIQALAIALLLFLFQALPQASAAPPAEPSPSRAAQMPPDVQISVSDVVASGFIRPLQVTHAGDGSGRLFVVDQQGMISVVSGTVLSPPFLDIRGLVERAGNEQGLLGLAFHPDYATNGHFYVDYTRAGDGATVLARYNVSADPNLADAASATVVMTVTQPSANHNGGQLVFGPDGYLYVGLGDGGGVGDPLGNGQAITTPLGAILRIDVDGGPPYGIPPDNPFVGVEGVDEIWDYGLRNPWRFSFDRLTGDLYIGDVGQSAWEEIDVHSPGTPGGLNFGWNCKEGTHDYEFTADCATADLVDPITEYAHPVASARSVTGGFVYRGSRYLALQGRYFFADFISGEIWSMYKTGSNPDTWSTPELELDTNMLISSFGEDEAGELYVVDLGGGTVRRLTASFDQRIYLPLVMLNATAP